MDFKRRHPPSLPPEVTRLSRSVVINQLLFSAGYSLTTGGFLTYFAYDLGAQGVTISLILALPELVGLLAVGTPLVLSLARSKKQLLIGSSLLARAALMLIPAAAFVADSIAFPLLLAGICLSSIFQAIAYTAYLSWLSELAPERNWGRFFARRDMAKIAILIGLPFVAASLRDWLRDDQFSDWLRLAVYFGTFSLGNLLQLISLVPLLKWPDSIDAGSLMLKEPTQKQAARMVEQIGVDVRDEPFRWRSFGFVLAFSFWLAFFQGMTQTAFFLHGYVQLQLSLTTYYALTAVMYVTQLGAAGWSGWWGDRFGYRLQLMLSSWVVSLAMLFWIASLNGSWWWLLGAYALWGGFGSVNLALQNLLLCVVPRRRNTTPIAFFRYGSGGIAGLTGIAGGIWLTSSLDNGTTFELVGWAMSPYLFIFVISFLGRVTAPLWLLGVREKFGR